MGIEHQKILCVDRGYHTYMAEALAEKVAEVWHYVPIMGQQPTSREDQIGAGLDGVEKIDDFETYKEKADLIFFPGEFDGEVCDRMWKEGKRAFGSGLSAEYEIDRRLFLKTVADVGLTPVKTYRAEGFDDAIEYFKKKGDVKLWVKTPYCRGDFDTIKYESLSTFMPWITYQRAKLGERASATIELLIQDHFDADVEAGGDRYIIDGKRTSKGFVGYEIKDKGYIYRVTDKFPEVIDDIDKRMGPKFKEKGYRGAWSTEIRINDKGEKRFTDGTARFGSPPGQGFCESFDTFAQDVFDVADGKTPKMKEKASHGAIIILTSWFNQENEICVEFPKEYIRNIKLQHHYKHEGKCFCLPSDAKDGYFGAVVAIGNSVKEATEKAKEIASQIVCLGLEYDESVFDKVQEQIEAGKKFGIEI
jgi:hypothetical protein